MAKGCPGRSEGKEGIWPLRATVPISPLLGSCRTGIHRYRMFVWRMSNHERMAASGITGGGVERPSWAQSGPNATVLRPLSVTLAAMPLKQLRSDRLSFRVENGFDDFGRHRSGAASESDKTVPLLGAASSATEANTALRSFLASEARERWHRRAGAAATG